VAGTLPPCHMILVVDKDNAICSTTTQILRLAGYEAEAVSDFCVASEMLSQDHVALVLLDIGVDFSGIRRLGRIPDSTGVILMCGCEDRREVPRVGPTFLLKPVEPSLLLEVVERELSETV